MPPRKPAFTSSRDLGRGCGGGDTSADVGLRDLDRRAQAFERPLSHPLRRRALEINVQQCACAGLNFGTCYDRSPIIAYDGSEHPAYTMDSYTPSTVPGCRTPHLWCEDGSSLDDAMGPEFTLLRFNPVLNVAALETAARNRGVPLKVLDIERPSAAIFYGCGLVLSRPDQHVAWRGDSLPADPLALIDRVRGSIDA